MAIFKFCFAQRLIKLSTPDVKVVGRGGSVEADGTGKFYTHYTYYYIILYYIIIYYYYIVPTICLLIGYEPTANFGNQGNVQIADN